MEDRRCLCPGRGKEESGAAANGLIEMDLEEITPGDFSQILQAGEEAELRMYHFKKKEPLEELVLPEAKEARRVQWHCI